MPFQPKNNLTPKAFANFSPGFELARTLGVKFDIFQP